MASTSFSGPCVTWHGILMEMDHAKSSGGMVKKRVGWHFEIGIAYPVNVAIPRLHSQSFPPIYFLGRGMKELSKDCRRREIRYSVCRTGGKTSPLQIALHKH